MRPDFLCLPRGSIVRLLFVAWALWLAAAGCSAASGHTRHAPVAAAEPAPPAAVAVPAGEEAELVLMNRQIVRFRAAFLGAPPRQRAERGRHAIVAQLERGGSDSVSVQPNPVGNIVLIGGQLAFVLTPEDTDKLAGETLEALTDTTLADGVGPARSPQLEPLLAEWLAHLLPEHQIRVRPVIDMNHQAPSDS